MTIIIIIIIIIIILVITFKHGIYNYMSETNHVPRVYTSSVAAVLYLQFALHVMLFTVCATCNVIYSLCYV